MARCPRFGTLSKRPAPGRSLSRPGVFPQRLEIVLTPSEEVERLKATIAKQSEYIRQLQADYNRLEYKYRCESIVNMRLLDRLKEYNLYPGPDMFK